MEAMVIGVMQNARDALKAGVGLAALGQRYAATVDDAALMGLIADFHKADAEATAAREKYSAEKHRVEALPECPDFSEPAATGKGRPPYFVFLKEQGVDELCDRWNELLKGVGRISNAAFATEAHTLRGAVEKLKIVYLAGDDEDLDVYDEPQGSWRASVMRDFDRLAGQAGDEPLVGLWAKYLALEFQPVPEGLTVEESDRFTDRSADQADDVAIEIVSAMPHTLIGAYAQIALLKNWAENAVPHRAKAALGRLYDRAEAALQAAAREEGGVS
ncbi:MAG: hypothetical protein IH906_07350 [Proteobacteria bacterium]|nr:hypothetical protein [Pseudomonadota bacterium]